MLATNPTAMNSSDASIVISCVHPDRVYQFGPAESYYEINIPVAVINSFLLAFIFIGNITVITAYFRNSALQSIPNMLLITLAIADLLVALVAQPLFMAIIFRDIIGAKPVCSLAMLSSVTLKFCGGTSLMTVSLVIAPERYLAICHPFQHRRWITKSKIKRVVFSLWLFILILSGSLLLGMSYKVYFMILTLMTFFAITLTSYTCGSIVIKLKRRRKRLVSLRSTDGRTHSRNSVDAEKGDFKVAITMFYIIGTVVVCYIPMFAGIVYVQVVGRRDKLYLKYFYPIAMTLVFFNSFLNPVIYCLRNKRFKRAIRKISTSQSTDCNSGASSSYAISLDYMSNT